MKLNNKALLTSGGIGVAIQILIAICGGLPNFAPAITSDPTILATAFGMQASVVWVACLCGGIITIGIGFAYVYFAKSEGPVEMASGAIGGAAAGAVASLIGGLLTVCLTVVSAFVVTSGDPVTALTAAIAGLIGTFCGGIVGAAIFGAIGGAIGAATVGKS